MARGYSRKKGKSGSKKPIKKAVPSWVTFGAAEVEMLIGKLAKEGKPASQIGMTLRDNYGIPDQKMITKKSITAILKEKNLAKELPEDILAMIKRSVALMKHLDNNKQDMVAKRGLRLAESRIGRLVNYYKATGVIPSKWKYDPKQASLYAE